MSFDQFMLGFGWLAAALFLAVATWRIVRLARLPLNVRWEVYPVPQESREKRRYGGSYMEETDWAARKRVASHLPAFLEIAAEVIALKRVRQHNRYGVWPLSLAMHWGLYLYFAWVGLLAIGHFTLPRALGQLTTAVGLAAFALGTAGAAGLMLQRATQRDLRRYTTPLDYFNLAFLAAFFIAGLVSWLGDRSFAAHRAYVGGLLSFHPAALPARVAVSFLLFELFLVYMPFTKLIHYFAKYFTFHEALWDDQFKTKDSAADRQVTAQLAYRPAWSAPHIAPGQTWLQQAQTTSPPDNRK
jgi:nitrate reductase gamma subunit